MSSLSSTTLLRPKNWQDFERSARELFAFVLGDPNTQMHGRTGQPQHGVDVYGFRDEDSKRLVGVQCKKSDTPITEPELKAELKKAKKFTPPIAEFILVTTAPRDGKIQRAALDLTVSLAKTARPILVRAWGWEDVEEHASKSSEVWNAFDPTFNPFAQRAHQDLALKLETIHQSVRSLETAALDRASASSIQAVATNENTPRKITTCQALIDEGHAKLAYAQLIKIREAEWSSASSSERYRLLVAMGAAQLRLGKQAEAGKLLLAAFSECPEHPKASLNQAKGFLLTQEDDRSAECARKILTAHQENADAAGTLIQALIENAACIDPLKSIPAGLNETPEVLISYSHFLRCRGNTEWIGLAARAAKLFPENAILKQFAAEAVLESTIVNNPSAIAGAALEKPEQFEAAVETLYQAAHDAIHKGYALMPPLAYNAALALRIVEDYARAKEVLDAAIAEWPLEENLKLQRALVAYAENDTQSVIETLPENPTNPEAAGLLADARISAGDPEAALKLLDNIDASQLADFLKLGFAATKIRAYLALGERGQALKLAEHLVEAEPGNAAYGALHTRVLRLAGDVEAAKQALAKALSAVVETTPLSTRVEIALEAGAAGRPDAVIELLRGRIATDRESPALSMLLAAAINGNFPVAAKALLNSISAELREREWYLQADAVLALNIGAQSADEKIGRYLQRRPADLDMNLARISLWQRDNRDGEIRRLLKGLDLRTISGHPKELMRLAALIIHYGDALDGLELGYSTLLNNWQEADAHLTYHGLLLANTRISGSALEAGEVRENCVVTLEGEGGQKRRYRIERRKYDVFGEEFLAPEHDLAKILLGKEVGESVTPHEHLGARPLKIVSIKSKYLDALHKSLDEFNERFPRSTELLKFTFDSSSDDPLAEMREVTRARAEASLKLLEQYKAQSLPLSFVGGMLGLDPLEAWGGLPNAGYDFRTCRGTAAERQEALTTLSEREAAGCVVDTITLSIIRRLKIEAAVRAICGPIYTTQSVIDLLGFRVAEAQAWHGKEQGALVWKDGELTLEKYSEEHWDNVIIDRQAELDWAGQNLSLIPAMPSADLRGEQRELIKLFRHYVTDPAIAAEGSQLLLLADDMGFRAWAAEALHVRSTWTQPLLMIARDRAILSPEDYSEAINTLALSRHVYMSMDSGSLLHQARKDDFRVTEQLSLLLKSVGGPTADLNTNTNVLARFVDMCWGECPEALKVFRITSEAFARLVEGRPEDQRAIVDLILQKLREKRVLMAEHSLNWLIGHSIGLPYFEELVAAHKSHRSTLTAES